MKKHTLATLILLTLLAVPVFHAKAETQPTVVELFTSEGCSSCPPAEALLRDLADRPDILALEFHVDYWDYIGWPDPYADARYTQRQRDYAAYFSNRVIYTPQMVFQGRREAPGSRRWQVEENLEAVKNTPRIPVSLTMAETGQLALEVAALDTPVDAEILLITYDDYRESQVTRGENAGKTLTHRHVVRSMESLGRWDGTAVKLVREVPPLQSDSAGCAVLVQARDTGIILGAASITLSQ